MMRLDKLLCEMNKGARSQVKKAVRAGLVTVNGLQITRPEYQVDEKEDQICYQGQPCVYEKYVYYMLHKPSGVVSAREDGRERTVIDLLSGEGRNDLFPVGRLDKDTEGLLVITNDGQLAHELLSPRKHVEKEYECSLARALTAQQIERLEQGVDIGEKRCTKPAKVQIVPGKEAALIRLTITEGKFHQVKRMLQAVDNEVLSLKRIRMGNLVLDGSLERGCYRRLEPWEVESLKKLGGEAGCGQSGHI
ncbi:MAG: rRNA pseudouridine synthase [Clostridiales bacterium]|nr:rRNA pseudouridine synthase [Clostridiales bacterium]